ncbi:MAG: hypothetical protein AABX51_04725, partial [Nanoarchaeota archaeon]
GDCGGYINFNGDYTDDGYSFGRAGRINGNQYKYCSEYQPNQKPADPGNFSFSQILGIPEGIGEGEEPEADKTGAYLGAGMSGLNFLKKGTAATTLITSTAAYDNFFFSKIAEKGWSYTETLTSNWIMEANPATSGGMYGPTGNEWIGMDGQEWTKGLDGEWAQTKISTVGSETNIAPPGGTSETGKAGGGFKLPSWFGNALASVGAGLSVANFMQAGFGANTEVSYSVGATYAAIMFFGPKAWFGPMLWISLAIALYSWIGGLGKTQKKYVTFTCLPWQPETGGLNCDLCNTNDPLGVPCSEYRCKSLGQTCEFINPRTEDEKCIKNDPNDISSPRIKPLYKNITSGYKYDKVSDSSFEIKSNNGECVPEYAVLEFG